MHAYAVPTRSPNGDYRPAFSGLDDNGEPSVDDTGLHLGRWHHVDSRPLVQCRGCNEIGTGTLIAGLLDECTITLEPRGGPELAEAKRAWLAAEAIAKAKPTAARGAKIAWRRYIKLRNLALRNGRTQRHADCGGTIAVVGGGR